MQLILQRVIRDLSLLLVSGRGWPHVTTVTIVPGQWHTELQEVQEKPVLVGFYKNSVYRTVCIILLVVISASKSKTISSLDTNAPTCIVTRLGFDELLTPLIWPAAEIGEQSETCQTSYSSLYGMIGPGRITGIWMGCDASTWQYACDTRRTAPLLCACRQFDHPFCSTS